MKAIVCTEYGPPEVLRLEEVPKPAPGEDQVLVKVHAASLNAADLETLRGDFIVRMTSPRKPRQQILGCDIAGRVEAVGGNVVDFRPGDEVWGDLSFPHGLGGFAEYVCVSENALAPKPASMTFEEAAAYPQAAIIALQSLRDKGQIQPGQKVLINGAGGGMGTFAVHLAKYFGAEVTAVDSAPKLDMLRAIGADHVIDYTQEDYTRSGQRYDLILDVAAYRSVFDYRRALGPQGIFMMVGGSMGTLLQVVSLGSLISMMGSQKIGLNAWKPNKREDLAFLAELFEAGEVVPVIDRRYSLPEVPEAMRYLAEEPHLGKIVITVVSDGEA
ncbi:MAG: NAD(P)-dependent alcohol dehydrogenase [Anaerolineae bacterium]|jgi:NADPH:quinone reductase-like Zn-dependent oxidoreductase